MRLSEAIRLGSMLKPQGFYELWVPSMHTPQSSCALGAAYDAFGYRPGVWPKTIELPMDVERLLYERGVCPACGEHTSVVNRIITHLNDNHRWSREQIANWVEMIEPADDRRARPEAADAVREDVEVPIVPLRA
jgi:hypothetical protein